MLPIISILWPSDGEKPSYIALQAAVEIAREFKALLYALRVVNQVPPLVVGTAYVPMMDTKAFDVPQYQQELLRTAEYDLSQAVKEKVPPEIEVVVNVEVGFPAEVINEFAQKNNIDLIVMATHGRRGFSRLMIGSVAEKTIRHSSVPLLILPTRAE
jgi:nucleotide-binding universal stress UspA family protein